MNSFKRIILTASLALGLVGAPALVLGPAQLVSASTASSACEAVGGGSNCDEAQAGGGLTVSKIVAFAIEILSYIVGIAAIIMVIIGGFKYVTSNGDANKVGSAKTTLIYALIGILVAGLAQVIVQFVINRITTP